jgi:hypothetical protein
MTVYLMIRISGNLTWFKTSDKIGSAFSGRINSESVSHYDGLIFASCTPIFYRQGKLLALHNYGFFTRLAFFCD